MFKRAVAVACIVAVVSGCATGILTMACGCVTMGTIVRVSAMPDGLVGAMEQVDAREVAFAVMMMRQEGEHLYEYTNDHKTFDCNFTCHSCHACKYNTYF